MAYLGYPSQAAYDAATAEAFTRWHAPVASPAPEGWDAQKWWLRHASHEPLYPFRGWVTYAPEYAALGYGYIVPGPATPLFYGPRWQQGTLMPAGHLAAFPEPAPAEYRRSAYLEVQAGGSSVTVTFREHGAHVVAAGQTVRFGPAGKTGRLAFTCSGSPQVRAVQAITPSDWTAFSAAPL
jgi:hypothetical protein